MPFLLRYCKKRTHQFLNFQTTQEIFLPTGTLYSEVGGGCLKIQKYFQTIRIKFQYIVHYVLIIWHASHQCLTRQIIKVPLKMRQVKGNGKNETN